MNDTLESVGECASDAADVAAELIVFDDDGPEGFYQRKYFTSSYYAARYFCQRFDNDMHCKITQVYQGDGR